MGGYDPYSSSKGACEIAINSWRQSFFHPEKFDVHGKSIASVRAGNVIGGGDWSDYRIIPDCIKSIESNHPIELRHPTSIRPWQHVLEPLSGYLLLGEKLLESPTQYCEGWNFGPEIKETKQVKEVAWHILKYFGNGSIIEQSNNQLHEANLLLLDITKANFKLGWKPTLSFNQCIQFTLD